MASAYCTSADCAEGCPCTPVKTAADTWDGSADTSWYSSGKTSFVITTAEQLAGVSQLSYNGVDFDGVTIKLGNDIDLGGHNFEPIDVFKGTFDGDGHTISNMTIDRAVTTKRYIGLIRDLQDGSVKNLTMDNAQLLPDGNYYDGYVCEMGIVAGMSNGNCLFENIRIKNSFAETYNNSVGGVCSESYGTVVFRDVYVDASNTFSALWQTPDGRVGGILGYTGSNTSVTFENCVSAPVLNVYNDVLANYQYYLYRHCGMLIGHITSPSTTTVTAKNTVVGFGDWNQYRYCEFQELGQGSYNGPEEWKYTRTDSGNSLVAPGHTHRSFEDHELLLPFLNLTGRSTGGTPDYALPGVTIKNTAYYFVDVENAEGSGIYPEGSTITLSAEDYDCCSFIGWEVVEGDAGDVASPKTSPTKVTVNGAMRIYAKYGDAAVVAPETEEQKPEKIPVTGDNSRIALWMSLLVLALIAGSLSVKAFRKSN